MFLSLANLRRCGLLLFLPEMVLARADTTADTHEPADDMICDLTALNICSNGRLHACPPSVFGHELLPFQHASGTSNVQGVSISCLK
jgi:hypothetical protein